MQIAVIMGNAVKTLGQSWETEPTKDLRVQMNSTKEGSLKVIITAADPNGDWGVFVMQSETTTIDECRKQGRIPGLGNICSWKGSYSHSFDVEKGGANTTILFITSGKETSSVFGCTVEWLPTDDIEYFCFRGC